jgi:uncharacterized protein (TIGR00290 family)
MKTFLSWSTGKDSAWALHLLKQEEDIDVAGLFTTVNEAFDRVAMHAVRRSILEAQADVAGLPLNVIDIPWPCPNEEYEKRMGAFVEKAKGEGVEAMAFGDLFLEEIREYRVKNLEGTGITPLFPVWGLPTRTLARDMVEAGLMAHVTCVDPKKLDASFAGRTFNADFLDDLPDSVDPCGENGEFHTCVNAGPMFSEPIAIEPGEVTERDGFVFADVTLG